MPAPATLVFTLATAEAAALKEALAADGWTFSDAPYAYWRAIRGKTNVVAYHSGKTTFQGADAEAAASRLLPGKAPLPSAKPQLLREDGTKATDLEIALRDDPQMFQPHAGIDESGKGDYFGPLVVACAFTDAESAAKLIDAGIRDSKLLASDKEAVKLDAVIKGVLKGRFSLITVSPERLNQLHAQIGNLNQLLAWGHAKALEELLAKVPECPRAISDQFGKGNLVRRRLQERGRRIVLDEHPKAEADIAVAAASILARAAYISEMKRLATAAGLLLPKGCSDRVVVTAREFLKLHPFAELNKYAKTFFKTTQKLED